MISDKNNVKVVKRPTGGGNPSGGQGNPSNIKVWGNPQQGQQGKSQQGQQSKPQQGTPGSKGSGGGAAEVSLGDRAGINGGLLVGGNTKDVHVEGKGNRPKALQTPGNDPKYQPDISDKTQQEAIADIKTKILDARKEAEKSRGSGGGTPRWFDKNLFKSKTNWKQILHDFITNNSQQYYDWGRPNKRAMAAGYYAPKSTTVESDIEAVIAIDTSGSMTGPVLNQFITEIIAIMNSFLNAKLTLLFWHTSVYKRVDIDTSEQDVQTAAKILVGVGAEEGGTHLSSIKEYFTKNKIDTANMHLLVLTDGHVEQTPQLPIMAERPIFLINSDSGTDEQVKKCGTVYFVDVEHKS
jgi:predicted metal-dependent peptidase